MKIIELGLIIPSVEYKYISETVYATYSKFITLFLVHSTETLENQYIFNTLKHNWVKGKLAYLSFYENGELV